MGSSFWNLLHIRLHPLSTDSGCRERVVNKLTLNRSAGFIESREKFFYRFSRQIFSQWEVCGNMSTGWMAVTL